MDLGPRLCPKGLVFLWRWGGGFIPGLGSWEGGCCFFRGVRAFHRAFMFGKCLACGLCLFYICFEVLLRVFALLDHGAPKAYLLNTSTVKPE